MINFGATYWAYYFESIFIRQIDTLKTCLIDKTLLSFDTLEEEAEKIAEEEYERLSSMPAGPDDFIDPAYLAEKAQDKAIDYYITMSNMKDGLIGLFTSGLYHLFEQQMFLFYNKAMLKHDETEARISPSEWKKLKTRFADEGIDLDSFKSFPKINVLRLISNVIKHAEGLSADELKKYKPDYFMPSSDVLKLKVPSYVEIPVELPLAGESLKVPLQDFKKYCKDVKDFWRELSKKLIEVEGRP